MNGECVAIITITVLTAAMLLLTMTAMKSVKSEFVSRNLTPKSFF